MSHVGGPAGGGSASSSVSASGMKPKVKDRGINLQEVGHTIKYYAKFLAYCQGLTLRSLGMNGKLNVNRIRVLVFSLADSDYEDRWLQDVGYSGSKSPQDGPPHLNT